MFTTEGKKILIIKLRYIGDALSLLPVIDNLNEKAPRTPVDVMVNKGTEELLACHGGIRKIWVYDRHIAKKSIVSSLGYHKNLIKKLRSERYDFVIDFTLGDRAAFLSFMTGARHRITYQNASTFSHVLMNRFIRSDPSQYHIVEYQLQALRLFGMNQFKKRVTFRVPESFQSQADQLLSDAGIKKNVFNVMIHPGARGKLRQWRPARFAEIARRIRDKYTAAILLIGGPGEGDLLSEVESHMGFSADLKSTALPLVQLAALMKRCHLFIGNDSAPAHIAAAVQCPQLTLFGPTFPHLWRPLTDVGEVLFKNVPCCGCRQESCIRPLSQCMDLIEVDEVWAKVEKLGISF